MQSESKFLNKTHSIATCSAAGGKETYEMAWWKWKFSKLQRVCFNQVVKLDKNTSSVYVHAVSVNLNPVLQLFFNILQFLQQFANIVLQDEL